MINTFNRILSDILSWINSVIWYNEGANKVPPYIELDRWERKDCGMFRYVKASPNIRPKDVGTIIFYPKRDENSSVRDIHICIDILDNFKQRGTSHTHQISILEASHWPDRDGCYQYEELAVMFADLQGQQANPNVYVPNILRAIAEILHTADPHDVNWPMEVDNARKLIMRGKYPGFVG